MIPQRFILHLDADAFFASVEQAADPRLRNRPVVVGGRTRGIVASASYEARRMGIYTPMPMALARRICPRAVFLPGNYELYETFSRRIFDLCREITPLVEECSIDEGYLDLGMIRRREPEEIVARARAIQARVRDALKITLSEGIGTTKIVSQVASKARKPNGFVALRPEEELAFLHELPVDRLPGVGPKSRRILHDFGLRTIGQIARTDPEALRGLLGSPAPVFHRLANNIDPRPVVPNRADRKSYSHQETFAEDVDDIEYVDSVLRSAADRLMSRVRADHRRIRTVAVRLRYTDWRESRASESLPEPTDLETDLYGLLGRLLRRAWTLRVRVRMASLKISNIYPSVRQLDLFSPLREKRERAWHTVDEIRRRYGFDAVRSADVLTRRRRPEPAIRFPGSGP